MNRIKSAAMALLVMAGTVVGVTATAPTASACPAEWTFAVGGNGDGTANFFPNWAVDTKVFYSGNLNDMRGGINAMHRDINAFTANCPNTRLILTGHSQGAAIVHVYITENPWQAWRIKGAVLYADPKQHPTGESNGSFAWGGYPIAGTDEFFNGVAVRQFCHWNDVICNRGAGWWGYLFQEAHTRPYWPYLDVRAYAGQHGIWWV